MIALAVAVILVIVATPSMRNMLSDNRTVSQANELVTAINLARSEALRGAGTVTVCASSDGATCNTADWTRGWIVRRDRDSSVIRAWGALKPGISLTANAASVTFDGRGAASTAASFSVAFSGCTGNRKQVISILNTGRINTQKNAGP